MMSGKRLKPRANTKAAALVHQAVVELATSAQTAVDSLLITGSVGRAAGEGWLESRVVCHGRRIGQIPQPAQPQHAPIA